MLIPIGRGLHAIIDDTDAEIVGRYRWHPHQANSSKQNYYVQTKIRNAGGVSTTLYLHRLLLNPPSGSQVDHINGDPLDNRRANIRICTPSQNIANYNRPNASGFRGISYDKRYQRWQAKIWADGIIYRSRWTKDPTEAARLYDALALEHHGVFAILNFPGDAP